MIDTVIFDLGKVLVDFHPEQGIRELGFSEEAVKAFMTNIFPNVWESIDQKPYSIDEVKNIFKQYIPEYENEVDILWSGNNVQKLTSVYDYSLEWIKDLKRKNLRVYVLSNFGQQSFVINSQIYSFLKYIDGQVISFEVSLIKPDLRIYKYLADKYEIVPENAVFIDDRKVNVDAAINAGFKGILFEGYESACVKLQEMFDTK